MIKSLIIKKIVVSVMLIVFAFSITPTILLHNWLANHTDSVKKTIVTNQEQVSKKLFNCHCDNIVAESPFTEPYKILIPPVLQNFSLPGDNKPVHFSKQAFIFHSLRGPPTV